MHYVIGNGKNYITHDSKGKLTVSVDIHAAQVFSTEKKAHNALMYLPKSYRNIGYSIIEVCDPPGYVARMNEDGEYVLHEKLVADDTDLVKSIPYSHAELKDWVHAFELVLRRTIIEKERLQAELEVAEREIQDLLHAAEFQTLDAASGYGVYRMLRESRLKRRACKDGLSIISCVLGSSLDEYCAMKVSEKIGNLNLDSRIYHPRVMPGLFRPEFIIPKNEAV